MNYQYTPQSYTRSAVKYGVRQQMRYKIALTLPGGAALWRGLGKALLVILPLTLVVNIVISSAIGRLDHSISRLAVERQQLEDLNIDLLARKARIWAPDSVERLAGDKLALFAASKRQIGKFNKRTGTFSYF